MELAPPTSPERETFRHWPLTVALSVSGAEDSGRFGFRRAHLDAMLVEISSCLHRAGIRLAYGGHLKSGSYTNRLADLVQDRVPAPGAIIHLAWPTNSGGAPATWAPWVEVRRCERPGDLDESLNPSSDSPLGRFAWARSLSAMRQLQTSEVGARIVIGGRVGTAGGYLGRMPGVLEETLLALRAKQPLYLIGAFGGSARLVVDALDGLSRRELTWNYHRVVPHSEQLKQLYLARGLDWDDYEAVADELRTLGFAGLENGLSVEENRELARSHSAERIAELLLSGLERSYPDLIGRE